MISTDIFRVWSRPQQGRKPQNDRQTDQERSDQDRDQGRRLEQDARSEGGACAARRHRAQRRLPLRLGQEVQEVHLAVDEQAAAPPVSTPDAQEHLAEGWRLFEQRRPGAAEKEFRAALAIDGKLTDAQVGIGMARLAAGNSDGAREELSVVLSAGQAGRGEDAGGRRQGRLQQAGGAAVHPRRARARLPRLRRGEVRGRGEGSGARAFDRRRQRGRRGAPHRRQGAHEAGAPGRCGGRCSNRDQDRRGQGAR